MLKKYSLKALEKAINFALSLDDALPLKLQDLNGKVLQIIIRPLDVSFFIHFQQDLQLVDEYDGPIDTIIHSSPLGLIRLSLLPASKARSLFNEDIQISGDIELGQQVKKLFDDLDIDWEGHLAHFTGDVIAYQLASLVDKGLAFKKQFHKSMQQNVSDYLQEELRILPTALEVNDFYNDIHDLHLDVERLDAHVSQLMKAYETN